MINSRKLSITEAEICLNNAKANPEKFADYTFMYKPVIYRGLKYRVVECRIEDNTITYDLLNPRNCLLVSNVPASGFTLANTDNF